MQNKNLKKEVAPLWFLSVVVLASNCGGSKIGNRSHNHVEKNQSGKKDNKDEKKDSKGEIIINPASGGGGGGIGAATEEEIGGEGNQHTAAVAQTPLVSCFRRNSGRSGAGAKQRLDLVEKLKAEYPQGWKYLEYQFEDNEKVWPGLLENNLQVWCSVWTDLYDHRLFPEEPPKNWKQDAKACQEFRKIQASLRNWLNRKEIRQELLRGRKVRFNPIITAMPNIRFDF
jgi:hypothetical protein